MKEHKAAKHGEFKCSNKQCNVTFISKSKLENHVKSIHGAHAHREYSCNKCPDTFKSENALQVHKNNIITTNGSLVMNVEANVTN